MFIAYMECCPTLKIIKLMKTILKKLKNIIDSSVTTSISPNSNEIFTNQEIGPNSGSSSFLMDTNKTQSTLEKGEKKVKSIFGFLAKGFLFLYVLFSLFLCLPSNHSDDVIVNEGGKTESITELSESKNTLSEKETLDNKSPICPLQMLLKRKNYLMFPKTRRSLFG